MDEIVEALEDLGMPVEQLHAEAAHGQFEVVTTHDDPLQVKLMHVLLHALVVKQLVNIYICNLLCKGMFANPPFAPQLDPVMSLPVRCPAVCRSPYSQCSIAGLVGLVLELQRAHSFPR